MLTTDVEGLGRLLKPRAALLQLMRNTPALAWLSPHPEVRML